MREINKQDIEFLKNLQHEMLTQDTVGQASPRFWVIRQREKVYGVDDDYGIDGEFIMHGGESIGSDLQDSIEWVKDTCPELHIERDCEDIEIYDEDNMHLATIVDLRDLYNFLDEYLRRFDGFELVNYREIYVIKEDTMFLTLRECEEHIKRNYYHYNSTVHPYAMTAWRSPQVEKLYEILENVDFDKLKGEN